MASFECHIDGGGFSACTSPQNYTSLADGSHTFQVRAINGAGNPDASPASFTWVVDATKPDVTVDQGGTQSDPTNTQPIHFMMRMYEPWMSGPPDGFTLMAGMVAPASRGMLRLSGAEPDDELLIDHMILSAPEDLDALLGRIQTFWDSLT